MGETVPPRYPCPMAPRDRIRQRASGLTEGRSAVREPGMLALVLLAYGLLPLCVSADLLPDLRCTPGDVDVTDLAVVCFQPARERRHVDEATRASVFARYGVTRSRWRLYELDHLIPLELGGSNDARNLWPEPWQDARVKDRAENRAHRDVCAGTFDLGVMQAAFALNWAALK